MAHRDTCMHSMMLYFMTDEEDQKQDWSSESSFSSNPFEKLCRELSFLENFSDGDDDSFTVSIGISSIELPPLELPPDRNRSDCPVELQKSFKINSFLQGLSVWASNEAKANEAENGMTPVNMYTRCIL